MMATVAGEEYFCNKCKKFVMEYDHGFDRWVCDKCWGHLH